MTSVIENTCLDSANPYELAQFWSQVLDLPLGPDDGPDDDEVGIQLDGDRWLLFLRVPEAKTVKNRMHVCLQPQQARDREVERLLGLGATMYDDRRTPDGKGWAVLQDPEGNEFCVLRSAAERHPAPTS